MTWQRSAPLSGPANTAMFDVVAFRDGFVAIGGDPVTGSVAWRSDDGLSWILVQPADLDRGGGMISLVALPDRLVAVGRLLHAEQETAAAWTSSDGGTWRRVDGGAAFEGAQIIRAIAVEGGLVAVGSAPGADAGVAWLSADGTTWERIAHSPALDRAFLWTVARTPAGLVAGGWRRADGGFEAALWTSPDGLAWTLEPPLPGGSGRQVRGIAVADRTLVAVGDSLENRAAVAWVAPVARLGEAAEWRQVAESSFADAALVQVTAGGPGFVAVGARGTGDAGIWTSTDGESWSLVPIDALFEDAYLTSIAATPERLVAAGALQRQIPGSQSYQTTPVSWVSAAE